MALLKDGRMVTIRARPQRIDVGLIILLAGIFTAAGVIRPDQVAWLVGGFLFACLIGFGRLYSTRLEITATAIRVKQGWFLAEKEAVKTEIRSVHRFAHGIGFLGPDGNAVLRVTPSWSMRQLLRVADELGVHLYDHRQWLGLRSVRTGRLVSHPPAARQAL
jgi:hypothetical protein